METSFQLSLERGYDTINETLGISDDRVEELIDMILQELENEDDHCTAIKEMTMKCKSDNEVAFVIYMYGHFTGHECEKEHGEEFNRAMMKFRARRFLGPPNMN